MNNHGYAIVLETTRSGWSAFVPDLDGCIAAANTGEETRQRIREAIAVHLFEDTTQPHEQPRRAK